MTDTGPPTAAAPTPAGPGDHVLTPLGRDRAGITVAHRAPGLLRPFTDAGVLHAADVHVATTLGRLGAADDEATLLAAALAVRAVRFGSVVVDLATIARTATTEDVDVDLGALPWPTADAWLGAVAASPLVAVGDDDPAVAPFRLVGTTLLLDRYWRHERRVAADLATRAAGAVEDVDRDLLRAGLDALFPDTDHDGPDWQRVAAATGVLRALTVIAGGPGTGKTTTVARLLALLLAQPRTDGQPWRIALAAPTGKAAARLAEAVHDEAATLPVPEAHRAALVSLEATTLHRLLGWRPDSASRFRHDRSDPLPHHVVVVDETSMVGLTMMTRLVEAVRPGARLVLVGDPDQLTSVEAGAVLGDVVGPCADRPVLRDAAAGEIAALTGVAFDHEPDPRPASVGDGIVVLRHVHRFTGDVGRLALAVQDGDPGAVVDLVAEVSAGDPDRPGAVGWIDADAADPAGALRALDAVRRAVVAPATEVVDAARAGRADDALAAMRRVQVLCAHRRGPYGVARWRGEVERWLTEVVPGYHPWGWFAGRPLLVTANDRTIGLSNGDTGVVVDDAGTLRCAFAQRGEVRTVSPSRLSAVETMYAMTIHKSQGSQFRDVVVVLPDATSPLLTRELLYTAVTRAERSVRIVGTADSLAAAVARPVSRASGLRERLWR